MSTGSTAQLRPFSVQAEQIFILDATVKRIEISARAR